MDRLKQREKENDSIKDKLVQSLDELANSKMYNLLYIEIRSGINK